MTHHPETLYLNLIYELEDTLDALDEKKHKKQFKKVTYDDKECHFMNRFLNHDVYDSLIYSGEISTLYKKYIQPIQDLFQNIKHHNKYLEKIRDIEDRETTESAIAHITWSHYLFLEQIEKKLLKHIPKMVTEMKGMTNYE